jgi:hypothetical protein
MTEPPLPCKALVCRDAQEKQIIADPDTTLDSFMETITAAAGTQLVDGLTFEQRGSAPATGVEVDQIYNSWQFYADG